MFSDKKESAWPVEPIVTTGVVDDANTPIHLREGYMIEAYAIGNVRFDKFDNRITRKYKGSKRPPLIWPEQWAHMTPKEKTKAILEHARENDPGLAITATGLTSQSTRSAGASSSSASPALAARADRIIYKDWINKGNTSCRHIIEWCCSEDSYIGSRKYNNEATNCVTTRITAEIDGTSAEGLLYAKKRYNKLKAVPTTIFASMPCTGGTQWNTVNKNNSDGQEKIRQHVALFDKLWNNFIALVKHCDSPTTTVVIEWPRNCSYWKFPKVKAFLESRNMAKVNFDGCFSVSSAKIRTSR
jgi:hypothetical protein